MRVLLFGRRSDSFLTRSQQDEGQNSVICMHGGGERYLIEHFGTMQQQNEMV